MVKSGKSGKNREKVGKVGKSGDKWLIVGKIRNFYLFGIFKPKWPLAAILDDRKSLSITFLAILDQYATFFFSKWPPAADRDLPL